MRNVIYQGKKIQLALESTITHSGQLIEREVVLHPGAVVILPMIDDDHVCLLRNHRFSVAETLLELPAGTLKPPESPEAAAVRELAEETGYQAHHWQRLAEFYPSPGITNERMYLFVASGLVPGTPQLEEDEQIETQSIPWDEARAWVFDGTIRDAKTLIGLLLGDKLRQPTGRKAT